MKRDYYELLGLAKGADPSAIKKPTESLLKVSPGYESR